VQDGACLKIEKFFYLSGLTQIDNGTGSFLQSGGTVSANCTLYLAGPSPATSSAQSTGVYTLAGGVLVINAPEGQEGIANGIGKGAFHFGKGTLVTNALAIDLENVNGGNFSPAGDEITGTTHLTGKKPRTYRQGAGGKMTITLASKNDHDRLMWNTQNGSSVVIEKGAVFEIVFLRNYRPKSGDVFTIITADRIELKGDPVIRVEGRPFKAQVLKETPQALQLVCQ